MFPSDCPQCKKSVNETSNRLVRDACGHQKCRLCLFSDEEKCRQCQSEPEQSQKESVIKCDNYNHGQNTQSHHTGVITCNGTPKKSEKCAVIQNNGAIKTDNSTNDVDNIIKRPSSDVKPPKSTSRARANSKKTSTPKRPYQKIDVPNHITSSNDSGAYKCTVCNKEFNTRAHIKYHLYCAGQSKPFNCETCKKGFVTKSLLDTHMLKHSGIKPFTCSICQKSFGERSKLNRHRLLHTSIKPFVCNECGKAFRGKESLKIHAIIHRGEKPYTCRICKAGFSDNSNLSTHLITHSNEKPHMCDQCGKRFKQKAALAVHRRSHLRERPHACSICHRGFVNHKDLQRHQLTHLENKAFACSICKTAFRRKDNVYRHIKNTHPGKNAASVAINILKLPGKKIVMPPDNPNAINVITSASPAMRKADAGAEVRAPFINGPAKLAFKTNTFKNNYNIHRNCDYDACNKLWKPYDMAESVNICQKILAPHSPPPRKSEPTSSEICQKILSPFPNRPLHYETSFEHKSHAIIKNIKFKLPPNYTNLKANETFKEKNFSLLNGNAADSDFSNNNNKTYAELKSVSMPTNSAMTSVIVNSSQNLHWRRRTLQNLCSKSLEN